mgnify:FL=1
MNRLSLSLPAALVAAILIISGCGGDPEPADPQQVLDSALSPQSLLADPGAEATADVESLGDGDRVLESRSVPISPAVYLQIRKALAESGAQPGKGRQGPPVVDGLESEGSTEIDGVEVDHVSGNLDVETLVNGLEDVAGTSDGTGDRQVEVPGLLELTRLEDTITAARFDPYARRDDGTLQGAALTLSLKADQSSLPPTRIRFSVTEKATDQEN